MSTPITILDGEEDQDQENGTSKKTGWNNPLIVVLNMYLHKNKCNEHSSSSLRLFFSFSDPISDDADTLFQSPTSVVGTNEGGLLIIMHIPGYSGSLMRMYRYVSSPFPLRDDIVVTIKNDKVYLALDPSGMLGKELSSTEVLKCDRINRIFHCSGENVFQKNLDKLCLYNLFNQRVDQIENLCRVEIDKACSHAIQLSGNQFLILVTMPTQLTKICLDGNTQVETIRGVYILTLSDDCPKANTPDHIFIRNLHVVSSQQLIALPLIQTAAERFNIIDNRFEGIDLNPIFGEIQSANEGPVSFQLSFRPHMWCTHIRSSTHFRELPLFISRKIREITYNIKTVCSANS